MIKFTKNGVVVMTESDNGKIKITEDAMILDINELDTKEPDSKKEKEEEQEEK